MARYVIFGAGRQGLALAYFLAKFGGAELITLADVVEETAVGAVEKLEKIFGSSPHSTFDAVGADVTDISSTAKLIEGHDVCISALPHQCNLLLTEASCEAGRHYCDFGFDTEIIRTQLREFDRIAKRKNIAIIPNNGVGPGLSNIIALQGSRRLDCDTVKIYIGGLPTKPANTLRYEELFSNLLHEYVGEQLVLRDGNLISVPVPSGNEKIRIKGFRESFEAFFTNTASSFTAEQLYREGKIQNFWEKTIRYKGHYRIIKALAELGFLSEMPFEMSGEKIVPLEFSKLLFSKYLPKCETDFMILLVMFVKEGKVVERVMMRVDCDPAMDFTAMQISTSMPVAIVAQMLAEGQIPPGVYLPEMIVDYERMMEELARRGIAITSEK